MTLPQHRNPDPDHRATAAYNFVPLPDIIIPAVPSADSLPNHNQFDQKEYKHTGYFEVELTTLSPLYIRAGLSTSSTANKKSEFDQAEEEKLGQPSRNFREAMKNKPDFFYTQDREQPVIPGSSLRGMLRQIITVLTYGKIGCVNDTMKVFYRAVAAPQGDALGSSYEDIMGRYGNNVRVGYLIQKGDDWYVQEAKKPGDFGWSERKPYLTVKEGFWRNNQYYQFTTVLSGFIPLNGDAYRPQRHPVSFDVEEKRDKKGKKYVALNGLGKPGQYANRGILVCSGNMLETDAKGTQSTKRKKHALVLPVNPNAEPVKISKQAVTDYLDTLTELQQSPPFDAQNGCLQAGQPVFFVKGQSEIEFFGHCPNFRVPARSINRNRVSVPADFVPAEHQISSLVDFPDALFGYVGKPTPPKSDYQQGNKALSFAGRIQITDANLNTGQKEIWLPGTQHEPVVLPILATPKPTSFQHYLTQSSSNRNSSHHYASSSDDTVIRGFKFYWRKGTISRDDLRPKPNSPGVDDTGKVEDDSTQHTQVRPVKEGVQFTFRVYFENLSDVELGALQWTLQLPDTGQAYCHALGMGKPLGMGSVKLKPTLHLTSRQQRYETLFANDQWVTGEGENDSQQDFCAAFEKFVLDELLTKAKIKATKLADVPRIQMLLKMLEWHEQDPMLTSKQPIDDLKIFRKRWVLPDPLHIGPLSDANQQGDGRTRDSGSQGRDDRGNQTGRGQRGSQRGQRQYPSTRTTTPRSTPQQPIRNVPTKQTTPPPASPPQPAPKPKPVAPPPSTTKQKGDVFTGPIKDIRDDGTLVVQVPGVSLDKAYALMPPDLQAGKKFQRDQSARCEVVEVGKDNEGCLVYTCQAGKKKK
ncbi:MAG: TIGR03986 family CRISPR-associated RAMP protein [Anaerolineales bacterium]|nr:TIGR03986 family CRISPR-associated RAMP protein [Anaerolineales bacterium]